MVNHPFSRVVIVPGNGCTPVRKCNFYGWVEKTLNNMGIKTSINDMPDPYVAKESIWLPFIKNELKADEGSIIVGHSSGAEAAMRYVEINRVKGIILVSPCVTDLGCENERASGYYSRPWEWDKMKENTEWIVMFGSPDDPFIPESEQDVIAEHLKPERYNLAGM